MSRWKPNRHFVIFALFTVAFLAYLVDQGVPPSVVVHGALYGIISYIYGGNAGLSYLEEEIRRDSRQST